MAIAKPRLHTICGICGCNKELDFEPIKREDGVLVETVYIHCRNCSSVTDIKEVMIERAACIPASTEEEKEGTLDLDKLEDLCRRTSILLKNREPGLITWNEMLGERVKDLREMLKDL